VLTPLSVCGVAEVPFLIKLPVPVISPAKVLLPLESVRVLVPKDTVLATVLAALTRLLRLLAWLVLTTALLLLAGLLAAALLLAGLLTRVLVLLTRILVRIAHSGTPLFGFHGETTVAGLIGCREHFSSHAIIPRQSSDETMSREPLRNYLCTSPLSRSYRCCRPRFPLLENDTTRRSGLPGGLAALLSNSGSVWIISPSN
jgi:ABC-type amino acid transport substrate-binding protein